MLKNGKSANRDEHQNRKSEVFGVETEKNRKTDLKHSQTVEPKISMPPSLMGLASKATIGKATRMFEIFASC